MSDPMGYRVRIAELNVDSQQNIYADLVALHDNDPVKMMKIVAGGGKRNEWLLENAEHFEVQHQEFDSQPDTGFHLHLIVLYGFIKDEKKLIEYKLRFGK